MSKNLLLFAVLGSALGSSNNYGTPKNPLKFLDQGNVYDHRVKQDRLRRMLAKQDTVLSRTVRYDSRHISAMEQIQKDLRTIMNWKNKEIGEQLNFRAKQESRIQKLIRNQRKSRKMRRDLGRHMGLEDKKRGRRSTFYDDSSASNLELEVGEQARKIQSLEGQMKLVLEKFNGSKKSDSYKISNLEKENKYLSSKIQALEDKFTASTQEVEILKEDNLFLEQEDQNQNYTLKWEIQLLQSRIIELEERINDTNNIDVMSHRLNILNGQVIENTIRNQKHDVSDNIKKDIKNVEKTLTRHQLQLINDTVQETNQVLDYLQNNELTDFDDKLWENEENIMKLSATVSDSVSQMDDIHSSLNGFSQSLESFSKMYQTIRDDVEVFVMNSTANMRAFDTTVDLSIDLLDRMGSFNEEITARVTSLEDQYYTNESSIDDYEDYVRFDTSDSDTSDPTSDTNVNIE